MFVAQISDPHVAEGRGLAFNVADGAALLEKTVAHIAALPQKPDCVVVSGDIAVNGRPGGYAIAARALSALCMPVYVLPGNHDRRENLMAALAPLCPAEPALAPYLCYTVEDFAVRLVIFDGTRPGSHSGHFDAPVAAWLEKTLEAQPQRPTLLFTHHPPFVTALGVMDEAYENAEAFGRILEGRANVRLCCGHLHRHMFTMWHGVPALTAPPVCLHIVPDFSAEGGDAFTDEAPAFLLHHFVDGRVNTHYCRVPGDFPARGPFSFSRPPKPHPAAE